MSVFVQQLPSVSRHFLLFVLVLCAWPFLRERPSFDDLPNGPLDIALARVANDAPPGWTLHGAWALAAGDPRLAGLSGIDCREGRLELVTDLGDLITLDLPEPGTRRARARIWGLPELDEGEALIARGGRIVIAQEKFGELLVVEPDGSRHRIAVPNDALYPNLGIEALIDFPDRGALLALHEGGARGFAVEGDTVTSLAIEGMEGFATGGARHPDGRAFVLGRRVGWRGFTASLSALAWKEGTVQVGPSITLPLPLNANAEGICIEPRGAGSTRLWVVTDDNGLPVMAQRLVAWDVPERGWPEAPAGASRD